MKPGDKVILNPLEILQVEEYVFLKIPEKSTSIGFPKTFVKEVIPRPFEVGDKVCIKTNPEVGEILCKCDNHVWVKFPNTHPVTIETYLLTHI